MAMTAFAATAVAQNLDPTVNVTRAYEGKLLEVDKPSFRMDVPDSVTKFNLDFDYSVMSNPYKGGNEFNPYLQDIRPERIDDKESSLWLRAGAGYGLHPELDFVWAPIRRNGFKMNIYGTHRSYVGRYRDIKVFEDGENYVLRPETYLINKEEKAFKGYDLSSRAGVNGRFDWESGTFLFDASYLGIATKDSLDTAFGVNDPDSKRAPGRDYNGADISSMTQLWVIVSDSTMSLQSSLTGFAKADSRQMQRSVPCSHTIMQSFLAFPLNSQAIVRTKTRKLSSTMQEGCP